MTTTYDHDKLRELAGVVGAQEFHGACDSTKPALWAWLNNLSSLSDDEFLREAQHAIFQSASSGRFRGNFEDDHCRASACYHESKRRHRAAGHGKDCYGPTLYSRAYVRAMRDQGHEPPASGASGVCHCEISPEVSR